MQTSTNRPLVLSSIAAAVLCACAHAPPALHRTRLNVRSLPEGGAVPIIHATVAGEPLDLILDTGAFRSVLPSRFMRGHGHKPSNVDSDTRLIDANGNVAMVDEFPNVPVIFEGETLPVSVDFLIPSTGADIGLLAPQDVVRSGGALVIDMGREELRYEAEEAALKRLAADTSAPLRELEYHRCLMEGFSQKNHRIVDVNVNGVSTSMMVDTGASHTALFRDSPALSSMLHKQGRIGTTQAVTSTLKNLFVDDVPIEVAGTKFVAPIIVQAARVPCARGLLGADLLRQCTLVWGASSLWLACRPMTVAAIATEEEINAEEHAMAEARAALSRNDAVAATAKLKEVMDAPGFSGLNSQRRHSVLGAAAELAFSAQRWSDAHALYRRATDLPEAVTHDWELRAWSATNEGDGADAVFAIASLARRDAKALAGLPGKLVALAFAEQPKIPEQDETRLEAAEALLSAKWRPDDGVEPNRAWRDLALHLAGQNADDRALEVVRRISSPHVLVSLRVDARCARLVKQNPDAFDIGKAATREVEAARRDADARPRSLRMLANLQAILASSGRLEEVISLADAAISRASRAIDKPYDDMASLELVRMWRSSALQYQGKWAEAVAELERARENLQDGGTNVDQSINLAALYLRLDRPKDALAVVADVSESRLNAFGRIQVEAVRLGAAVELRDTAAVKASLEWLREHHQAAEESFEGALVVAGRTDEAARLLIERLADPRRRSDALLELQHFRKVPQTRRMRINQQAWRELLARSDVKTAVASAGTIEAFDLIGQ